MIPSKPIPPNQVSSLYDENEWDYRPFLRHTIEKMRAEAPRKLSYSALAKLFGFKSKSFLQHVLACERHLSLESAERIARYLAIKERDRSLFLALVRLASLDSSTSVDLEKRTRLRNGIRKARKKAKFQFESLGKIEDRNKLYSDPNAALVYAALGKADTGARLADVLARTRLSEKDVRKALAVLLEIGIADRGEGADEDIFFPKRPFIYDQSEDARNSVKAFFLRTAREGAKKADLDFSDPTRLFLSYAVSIDSRNLPVLRERMKKVLSEFVLEGETPDGDHVARIALSLF